MTSYIIQLAVIGGVTSAGVYLLLERSLVRMLMGLLLVSNAVNLLLLTAGGKAGSPPIRGATSNASENMADPLRHAMILTAIVITMGVAAFVLALAYRSYWLTTVDEVSDDPEDTRVSQLSDEEATTIDADRPTPPGTYKDTDAPDEIDALPGHRGSR